MSISYQPARYLSSRPWAKRVAHLFSDGGTPDECDALLTRVLQAAPGDVGKRADRQALEHGLAQAYGRFVRGGRQIVQPTTPLLTALADSAAPATLPAMSALSLPDFFIALPDAAGAGAFISRNAARGGLDVVVLAAGFAVSNTAWWQGQDSILVLHLQDGDSLALPDNAGIAPWASALQQLFGLLAVLAQPHCVLTPIGPANATLPILQMGWCNEIVPTPHLQRAGYWRRQAGESEKRVWVLPRYA